MSLVEPNDPASGDPSAPSDLAASSDPAVSGDPAGAGAAEPDAVDGSGAPDPIAGLPRAIRPEIPVAVSALAWAAVASTPAAANMASSWNDAVQGLAIWLGATLFGALPVGALSGLLAARMERAATGLRHPQRGLWVPAGAGAVLVAHWALHLVWSPLLLVSGLGGGYRAEDRLVGAVLGLLAWILAAAGVGLLAVSHGRLTRRDWTGVTAARPPRRLPRPDTPWVAAALYGCFVLVPGGLVGAFAVEEEPALAVGAWLVFGLVGSGAVAGLASALYRRLPHALHAARAPLRFRETLGAVWAVHWLPPLLMVLLPIWRDRHHDERLAFAVGAALFLVLGVAMTGVARAHRGPQPALPREAAAAAG